MANQRWGVFGASSNGFSKKPRIQGGEIWIYKKMSAICLLAVFFLLVLCGTIEGVEQKAMVYVAVEDGSLYTRVAAIDMQTREVQKYIPIGKNAFGGNMVQGPNGQYVYLAGNETNNIYIINILTDTVEDSISIELPRYVDVTPDGQFLYSITGEVYTLSIIDLRQKSVLKEIQTGGWMWEISITPDGRYAYVSGEGILVVDTSTRQVIKKIDTQGISRSLAWREDKGFLYAVNSSTTIAVIDSSSQSMIREILAPVDTEEYRNYRIRSIQFDPCAKTMFLCGQVISLLLNIETGSLVDTAIFPSSSNEAQFTPDGFYIYTGTVPLFAIEGGAPPIPGKIFVLSTANREIRIIGELDLGLFPFAIETVIYPPPLPGDFNSDLHIDFVDFLLFIQAYGTRYGLEAWNCVYDLNRDGAVNFPDFLGFAQLYMEER